MSVIYGDPVRQAKYEAASLVDKSGYKPMSEAISCAVELRRTREKLAEHAKDAETLKTLSEAITSEFMAWEKICSYLYAKPKQSVELSGQVSLERLLGDSWEKPIAIREATGGV